MNTQQIVQNEEYILNSSRKKRLTDKLLSWYDKNKRELPWRITSDPYSIWISEIMAQQTRIAALLPYYQRFISLFPTVHSLAQAGEDDVLKAWEGLGYYARARNLHKAAQIIVHKYGGILPSSEKELLGLPGIGPYTAGAILSIAYHKPVPAVDGNVLRVFARLENNDIDISLPMAKTVAAGFVKALMPARTSAFTQALMELGALVCVPKTPACESCPLVSLCLGHVCGHHESLPTRAAKKPIKHMDKTMLLICNPNGSILMRRRSESLLNGMWVFYMIDGKMNEADIQKHIEGMGYSLGQIIPIGESRHVFTHITWEMNGFFCPVQENFVSEELAEHGYTFLDKQNIRGVAVPSAVSFYKDWFMNN